LFDYYKKNSYFKNINENQKLSNTDLNHLSDLIFKKFGQIFQLDLSSLPKREIELDPAFKKKLEENTIEAKISKELFDKITKEITEKNIPIKELTPEEYSQFIWNFIKTNIEKTEGLREKKLEELRKFYLRQLPLNTSGEYVIPPLPFGILESHLKNN